MDTATRPLGQIPQEIMDAMIDFLEEDTASLRAAGLVQKAWYHRTRKHIFRDVSFGGQELKDRSMALMELLEERPTLAHCIKQLTLNNPACPFSDLVYLIAIIPFLTSLTGFTMKCRQRFNWALLSDKMAASLYGLMSNHGLEKLTLMNVKNMDIAPLSQFHNLRELTLWFVTPPSEPSVAPLKPRLLLSVPPTPDNGLRFLQVYSSGKALKTLISSLESAGGTLDLFRPTTLSLETTRFDNEMEEAWTALLRCGAFVESYHVLHDADLVPPQAFALRRFPKLKHFSMSMTYYTFHIDDCNPLPCLLKELDYLSQSDTPHELSKIGFDFDYRSIEEEGEELDIDDDLLAFATYVFWTDLDAILAKRAFSRLTSLIITFRMTYSVFSAPIWEKTKADIMSAMSNFSARPGNIVEVRNRREAADNW